MPDIPCITDDMSNETATIERAVANNDEAALTALVCHYRALATGWQADAEEKARTIAILTRVLTNNDLIDP